MTKCSNIYILEANENSAKIIESYIKDLNIETYLFNDYRAGLNAIKEANTAPIVIACNDYLSNNDILENIKLYTSKIIIISTDYSTDSIVRAMRLGAKEFLPKPVIKNDLLNSVRTLNKLEDNESVETSKIIAIYSNKGGIGKTTIATNLAAELAKSTRDKVALLDLNLHLGDVSTFLNINPTFDVNYVMTKLIEKKEDSILKAFENYKNSNLYILADPHHIEHAESIHPYEIEGLLKSLKKLFPYIIIDMSSNIDPNTLKILDCADLILFTSIVNIPAIRNCQRCLNLFNTRRYPKDKVKIIINRYMENDEMKIEDM